MTDLLTRALLMTSESSAKPTVLPVDPPPSPTTIDGLLGWAKWHPCTSGRTGGKRHNHSLCEAGAMIVTLLDVALPCGAETPTACVTVLGEEPLVDVPDVSGKWSVEDARGIAAAILRAAEAAEAATTTKR